MFSVISVTRGWVGVQFPENSVTQHLNGPLGLVLVNCKGQFDPNNLLTVTPTFTR